MTKYMHLSGVTADLINGAFVQNGDLIGYMGNSGSGKQLNTPMDAFAL